MLTANIRKYILPALFVLALAVSLIKPSIESLSSIAQHIQTRLNNEESFFYDNLKGSSFESLLESSGEKVALPEFFTTHGIYTYLYLNNELTYWTGTSVQPLSITRLSSGTSFIKLKNGWYQAMKWEDTASDATVLGLLPVKYDYPFENKFLKNDFALGLTVPDNIELSDRKLEGSVPVKSISGQQLFSLYLSGEQHGEDSNMLILFSQLILLALLFYYIFRLADFIVLKRGFVIGFGFFVLTILVVRLLMLFFNLPPELSKLALFDPRYYASSAVTKSLGDLAINVVLMTWVAFYLYSNIRNRNNSDRKSSLISLGGILLVFLYTVFILWIFKTLVIDSVISFEIYNVLSLDFYSLIGLICIALLFVIHFLLARVVLSYAIQSKLSNRILISSCIGCGVLFAVVGIGSEFFEAIFYTAFWITSTLLLFIYLLRRNSSVSIRDIIIYVSVYGVISTLLVENLYERKERNSRKFFSGKLVSERDFIAEYMFSDVAARIKDDEFIINSLTSPLISKKEIMDRINVLYLGGYFNKYNFQLYVFDANGTSIKSQDSSTVTYFQELFRRDSSGNNILHYISDSALNYSYLSVLPFHEDSVYVGSFVIKLNPKIYYGQNVYPELLLGSSLTVSNNLNNYAYAIYQNDKLIAQYGDYPFSYYWNNDYKFADGEFEFIEQRDWELSIQRFSNGKKVIVAVLREPVFEPVATFSYLFTFYFLVLGVVVLAFRIITAQNIKESIYGSLLLSFRTRINFSMLLMILVSFLVIGFTTISFFSRQYDNFYTDRLLRKEKVIHASLEYFVQKNVRDHDKLGSEVNFEIARLADINTIDINLFDRNGDLIISSQPVIYEKGILSRKMNPSAYFELENNKTAQVIEQEGVGRLKYLATYTPIRNTKGEAIAYLGIPYFERSKNINDEVSSFLVALMNVYVFLLICAAILAYFISNSITRPLTIISEKLRFLNLNKQNEPIEWNSKDEIGVLIGEYNKMINELETSAKKLAKGERESAWREMAKQIAHEIKNPLTPMKLSVQYLQRAIDEGNPNIDQLARKVAKTLEEQIENLSRIATAFSSFAKMPRAQNEIINVNELLKSIADLFGREENASINFTSDAANPTVFADKNQLVSVFNNLIKNGIQSIPEGRKGFVDVNIKEEDGWVLVSVSDNGNGIPSDNYEKVFVPNFTTKSSGTGLGLAITKQIIEAAGGKIWFESAENVGTTFFVKVPESKP